jgi:type II secretory pathway pseudopilin PulG
VEVAIVALMVGIIAVAAIPTLSSSLEDARLTAAASEVVTAFEFAQLSAATTGRQTQAIIKSGSGRIEVKQYKIIADLFTGGDTLASADVESGTFEYMQYPLKKGTDYNIQMQDEDRFKGVEITVSSFDTGASVFFDSLGTPSKGGSVTLTLGSRQMAVTLDALTGKVTVTD